MAYPEADDRPPPLRLVCSDELGQLKGVLVAWEMSSAVRPKPPPTPCPAVVQTADGTHLGTATVTATW